jgi:Uri superfamily endonuclease
MSPPLPSTSGTYAIILGNAARQTVTVGRLGELPLRNGYYLYVGSAFGPGGLRARLAHHLSISRRPHWHIDYLRRVTEPAAIWFQQHSSKEEHRWAQALARGRSVENACPDFGASDCACTSHLFFSGGLPEVATFRRRLRALGVPGGACARALTSETSETTKGVRCSVLV